MKIDTFKNLFAKYWLAAFIVIQPFLDLIAYFNQSGSGTLSGYLRLTVMFVMCFAVLIKTRSLKIFFALAAIASLFCLHILNGIRTGYISPLEDISYAAKTAYLPVMAVCLSGLVQFNEHTEREITGCFNLNLAVIAVIILLSYITDSYMATYDGCIGISGWVPESNRCCHSDILSGLCVFAAYSVFITNRKLFKYTVPFMLFVLLISNGTRACYGTLFVITAGYPIFIVAESIIKKQAFDKSKILLCVLSIALFVAAFLVYPISPRHEMDTRRNTNLTKVETEFAADLAEMGYDGYNLTEEQLESDSELKKAVRYYYARMIYGSLPVLIETYDTDRIMKSVDFTIRADILADTRVMKKLYASFIFADSDSLTRLTGFEFARLGTDHTADLENDWYAIFYYYGYIGFAAYVLAVLWFIFRVVRRLIHNFKSGFDIFNFTLAVCFFIQIGLGYFSGGLFRRPNASIYLAFVAAMLYHRTELKNETVNNNTCLQC